MKSSLDRDDRDASSIISDRSYPTFANAKVHCESGKRKASARTGDFPRYRPRAGRRGATSSRRRSRRRRKMEERKRHGFGNARYVLSSIYSRYRYRSRGVLCKSTTRRYLIHARLYARLADEQSDLLCAMRATCLLTIALIIV